jgi:lysine 6-dehydrogenase
MKAAVFGSGLMGSVIARDLSESKSVDQVTVVDIDEERLARLRRLVGGRKLSTDILDVREEQSAKRFLAGFDVVASALPHGSVNAADRAAMKAGAKMVDIAFEDVQMEMDSLARKNGGTLIPGCGLAPGLGGILLAYGVDELPGAEEGHILVGGIPQKPRPPFGYKLVFSVIGLLREYTDDARVVRNGKTIKVKPFSTLETVDFPLPIGELEAFCTDGLASLLYTVRGLRVMDEKTLRWPGHVDKMRALLESGFFSEQPVETGGGKVIPMQLSRTLLAKKLSEGDPEDMTVLRVEVSSGKRAVRFDLVDFYDPKKQVTSMGRTTGYTCSIVAQMLGEGEIRGAGVIPPEVAVKGPKVDKLLKELKTRGVRIRRSGHLVNAKDALRS